MEQGSDGSCGRVLRIQNVSTDHQLLTSIGACLPPSPDRKSAGEVPLVSRPELDTRFRPNCDGSIAVELYFVLPSRTFGQFLGGEAKHRLDETCADRFRSCTSPLIRLCLLYGLEPLIHTAFIHDFSKFKANCETDRRAIEAIGSALAGSDRPLVITSGTALVALGRLATKENTPDSNPLAALRGPSEEMALSMASRGVRVSLVRLPPIVHGDGDHGFVPALIGIAREKGVSAYIGDGLNRWPAVHRLDAAHLYRLALEKGSVGAMYHGVAEEGIPMRAIAETIGAGLGVPVRSLTGDEAQAHFDWMAGFVAIDNPTSSALTRDALGWNPKEFGLLTDIKESGYFFVSR